MRITQAQIFLSHFSYNMIQIKRNLVPETKICVPVKADAYGHGAVAIARTAEQDGADYLAVASVQEGIELRSAGIGLPILVLSLPAPDELSELVTAELTAVVCDMEFAGQLETTAAALGKTVSVHLKIDTGMGRIGCRPGDAAALARDVSALGRLRLSGVCTHLSVSDSLREEDIAWTNLQIDRFSAAVSAIRDAGIDPGIVHCANSGAVLLHPRSHFDMVRPGIVLYGYPPEVSSLGRLKDRSPVRDVPPGYGGALDFLPVMELVTAVSAIKRVCAGEYISYGRTWQASCDTWIATLPLGYADGLLRRFVPGLTVLIGEKSYPVVGRICMDQCMVDLGPETDVERWDRVVVFGPEKNALSAADIARMTDTIPYEITCGISKRVPRVYIKEDVCQIFPR
ncbi:MAG: alanine racemase [Spirochaetaceae bacterium]|jgi:alanine racemase|nr:alanine racemase [Spirochaetaceae bacterium]